MGKILKSTFDLLKMFWRGVDQARRWTINLLFLVLLAAAIVWSLADRRPEIPEKAALVLAPYGDLVEELSGDPDDRAILALLGERQPETLVRDLVEAVDEAAADERIQALFLKTDSLGRAGLSKLQTLRASIDRFRQSGKKVVAAGDYFSQGQYYLASTADEIHMNPLGLVFVTGYGSYRNYYKEALDKLSVDWHVFRVGEYKSAVEPYLRSDMSPEARESRRRWLTLLWQAYREDVESARGLEGGALDRYATAFPELLAEHGGDAAAVALELGLVDELAYRDQVRERMIELVGKNEDDHSFSQVGFGDYLRAVKKPRKERDQQVAVVVARGAIYDGSRPPGNVGGDSIAKLIREAREDDRVKALVLRVDSPGGSAFASEIIRRELELFQEDGKPVVASMGSVAASGGYWISMSADEIWAMPTTITGSIGIYAMLPTFPRTLERLGIRNDGVGTGSLAGTLRPERPLPDAAAQAMEMMVQQGYRDFIERVAAGRDRPVEEIDAIARGRVWVGRDALDLGLIDKMGGLDMAIEAAAGLADLGESYRVRYLRQKRDWRTRALDLLTGMIGDRLARSVDLPAPFGTETELVERLVDDLSGLDEFGDPAGFYAYCFCEPN